MSEIRWGVIGTGSIARAFARDLQRVPGQKVTAVGSRTIEKATAFASEFDCAALGSYQALVESDVDAVYVATPHPMHAPNTILALSHGKPVLCEKPFAVNARESSAMIAEAKNLEFEKAANTRDRLSKIKEMAFGARSRDLPG